MTRVAINGFGRIGRLVLRELLKKDIEVVAINDLVPPENLAYLFKFDSTHRHYEGDVYSIDGNIIIDNRSIAVFSEKSPELLPWKNLNVEYVIESTLLLDHTQTAPLFMI